MPQPMKKVRIGSTVDYIRLPAEACPICPQAFGSEVQLIGHVSSQHGIVQILRCAQGRPWWT